MPPLLRAIAISNADGQHRLVSCFYLLGRVRYLAKIIQLPMDCSKEASDADQASYRGVGAFYIGATGRYVWITGVKWLEVS